MSLKKLSILLLLIVLSFSSCTTYTTKMGLEKIELEERSGDLPATKYADIKN